MVGSNASLRGSRLRLPGLLSDRRAGLSRLVFRLPLALYRLGLGWMFGHQFLVLSHAGRRSGRIHETVLKVLHYDPATDESIVASAWGERTDWYRNIRALPAIAVRTGNRYYVPQQRNLLADEAFAVFNDWTRRQRWFARLMLGQIGQRLDVSDSELRRLVATFPCVAFSPMRFECRARRKTNQQVGGVLR